MFQIASEKTVKMMSCACGIDRDVLRKVKSSASASFSMRKFVVNPSSFSVFVYYARALQSFKVVADCRLAKTHDSGKLLDIKISVLKDVN